MSRLHNILKRNTDRTIAYQPGDTLVLAGYFHTFVGSDGKGWQFYVIVPKGIPTSLTLSISGSVNNIISVSGGVSTNVTINEVSRVSDNSIAIKGSCANSVGAQQIANLATSGITITFS